MDMAKFLLGKNLFIDLKSGLQYFSEYASRMEQVKELGYETVFGELKRASSEHQIIGNNIFTVSNKKENIDIQEGSIVKLNLTGSMMLEDGLCHVGVRSVADSLLRYKNDQRVSGAIIEINSGGGESSAGEYFYTAIKTFGKPVIAIGRTVGSAAYLTACGCTEILASSELSEFGSIGAYIPINKEVIDYLRETMDYVYSDLSDEKNKGFRDYIEGNKQSLREDLNLFVEEFHNIVKSNRPLKGDIENTLKGGMFLAKEALNRGLIDGFGDENEALKRLKFYTK